METDRQQKDLQRIMAVGSSLAGGALAASLQVLRPNFSFQFSIYTVIAFLVGMVAFIYYWRLAFAPQQDARTRRQRHWLTAFLVIGGFAGVLYPLRFVDSTKLPDLIIGLVAATLALSGVFFLLYLCRRFLEKDHQQNAQAESSKVPSSPAEPRDTH